jgi:hypothetical protein
MPNIVGVQESHVFSIGILYTDISGSGWATSIPGKLYKFDSTILLRKPLNDTRSPIGGAVIDYEKLPVRKALV